MHIPAELERQLLLMPNLPSPPVVATRLIECAKQPELEAKTLATVISMDSALSAKLLRIANSPLYAQCRKTETVRQAITVLGLNSALAISLSFSLLKSIRGTKIKTVDLDHVWRRSFLAAICARSIGEAVRCTFVEELFLAGLLQDIGLLALARIAPELYTEETLLSLDHEGLIQRERNQFGADHAEVGAWLLKTWNMPERTVEAVTRSHMNRRSEVAGSSRHFNEVVVLSGPLADWFLGKQQARACAKVYLLSKEMLGFDEERLHAVLARVQEVLADAEALFEMKLVANPEEIIAQARELLMFRQLTASAA
jgi:HD-like signal output (HDOD) protein